MDAIAFWLFVIALPLWLGDWRDPGIRDLVDEVQRLRRMLEGK